MNNLFLAEEFNKPTPLPAGKRITAVYFHTGTAGTRTFTNLHILLKQDIITTLTTGAFYPGPYDTVFVGDTSLTSTVGGWMKITLKNKFNYDPTKSLILFVGQCGASGSGLNIYNAVMAGSIRRTLSVGGCPFVASTGGDAIFAHFGVDVEPAAPVFTLPDLIYYKFKNNPSPASTPNFAIPGVGTNPAPLTTLTLTSGGQFDSCLSGTATASAKIATGYNLSTGTSSFT
ncbi:MAG: hypothetical protein NTV87_15010, partial [Ignavibacteriae bacterium]|nr:hypothetical protein [Ignavibacteriota bacterium]